MATTFNDTPENEELVLIQLALHLGKKSNTAIGDIPDDEELAAFADQSMTDDTRRAQILSHIASNHQVYHRWISLVEAIGQLETQALSSTQSSRKKSSGFFSWLFANNVRTGVFGGGMATVAIALVVVILLPVIGKVASLDDQYDRMMPILNAQWDSLPHQKKTLSGDGDTRSFQFLSAAQSVVEYGFHHNASRIGDSRFESIGIIINKDISVPVKPENVSSEQYLELQRLGKLVALTTIQCELKMPENEFKNSFDTAKNIMTSLKSIEDDQLTALSSNLEKPNKKLAVCGLSNEVLRILF